MNHIDAQAQVSQIMTSVPGPAPTVAVAQGVPVTPPAAMETTPFIAYQNQLLTQQNQLLALLALILIDLKETINYQAPQPR